MSLKPISYEGVAAFMAQAQFRQLRMADVYERVRSPPASDVCC